MSAIVVPAGGVALRLDVPDAWASGPHGRDTVVWDAAACGRFRPNVVVRVHGVGAGVGLDALVALVDDELDDADADGAAVERRGRTDLAVAGGRAVAALATFDVDVPGAPARLRVAQLHAFVDPSDDDASRRAVFHVVATGALDDAPRWREPVTELLTSAAVQRGTRAARR